MSAFDGLDIEQLASRCTATETHADVVSAISGSRYLETLEHLRVRLVSELGRHTAVEWFLDNFYLISETARALRRDLPVGFYRKLPAIVDRTASDGHRRLPRTYVLARELLTHLSRPPDHELLETFLEKFQQRVPLYIGELWVFPAMLRAVCLDRIVSCLSSATTTANALPKEVTDAVSLSVRTLIALKSISWRQVFERCSLVERELARDPARIYQCMDFSTRDQYRRAVEELASRIGYDELVVANRANEMARVEAGTVAGEADPSRLHVGYYLIDHGRAKLESALGVRLTAGERLGRLLLRFATPVYLVSVAAATLATLAPIAWYLMSLRASPSTVALACGVALIPASAFAVAWVQWIITNLVKPVRLPRMAMEQGIDADHATVVVIPTLFGDLDEVHRLVHRLELHYLANPDPELQFAILADHTDATSQTVPRDEELRARAREGIHLLNQRYGTEGGGPFHLLVRERRFNATEGVWMGWERKRGKLEEFNRLLTGSTDTSYTVHVGDQRRLENIRFVITLDSDTELPRDAARRLVVILAHPLNRARFARAANQRTVTSGYTVLQPRLEISPDASNRSRFSRIFAGDTGLDIYSRAVSNVYQDFFGTGVYVGKGIYDVDAFRRCLEGRIPENAVLSHDLFEGIYGRVGLASDVVLYEDYPPSYPAYSRRLHRWIRGDWQLVPWLRSRVPIGGGSRIANPFSHIDRWKLLDNLRRSLLPVALLALLVSGWTWLPGGAIGWTAAALLLSSGHVLTAVASRVRGTLARPRGSMRRTFVDVPNDMLRWLISLVFLPHESVVVADAVVRTVVRMAVTRKRLLEWTTAAHTAHLLAGRGQRSRVWWELLGGPSLAVCVVPAVWVLNPAALGVALGLAVGWLVSPEIALFLAKQTRAEHERLTRDETQSLRELARRTWLFFETFVGPDDHWLPPDNVQLVPSLRIAHRTSPTNIGLYLASCASACDLGYLGVEDFCARVQSTMRTVDRLPRHRGQLLNWYDTQTLDALHPKYISTVDNGNFAASLIAVRQACGDYATAPILRRQCLAAFEDVTSLLERAVSQTEQTNQTEAQPSPAAAAMARIRRVVTELSDEPDDIESWPAHADTLSEQVDALSKALGTALRKGVSAPASVEYEVLDWLDVLTRQIGCLRTTLDSLVGWLFGLLAPPEGSLQDEALQREHELLCRECFDVKLDHLRDTAGAVEDFLAHVEGANTNVATIEWAERIRSQLVTACERADVLLNEVLDLGARCEVELARIDFRFLYDTEASQMFIGYDVSSSRPDRHHYDLLASEARLASLVAIALGQAPIKHWVHLERPVARVAGETALLSWSGTMFEYLMPLLFTRSFPKTLLGRSALAAIKRQMQYARKRRVPWGISESAFASTDAKGDYQYRAFGTPGLGLRRGLDEDLVVAPYASLLAVGLRPRAVFDNLGALKRLGAWGTYGAMEALDFSPQRLQASRATVVQAYMAHHQGMGLVALGNLLAKQSMVERFHADPRVQTVAHLLQERLPEEASTTTLPDAPSPPESEADRVVFPEPWEPISGRTPATTTLAMSRLVDPALHVLSNGKLSLLCDSYGRSRLSLGDIEIRPRDLGASHDRAGSFCLYLQIERDPALHILSGAVTAGVGSADRRVTFWPHRIETITRFDALTAIEDVFIAPDENLEIRRVRLTNEGEEDIHVHLTGYAEVSIQRPEEHHRHPAFSRLFLQTESREQGRILLCRRRPRGPDERFPVVVQAAVAEQSDTVKLTGWETSRRAFVGRGRSLEAPQWVSRAQPSVPKAAGLRSGCEGHVLDPCLAQTLSLHVAPGASQTVAWFAAVGVDEQRALEILSPHLQLSSLPATLEQCKGAIGPRLGQLGMTARDVVDCQHLLSQLVHRPRASVARAPSGPGADRRRLWGYGISGDRPIVVVQRRSERGHLLERVLRAHNFLEQQNVHCDLVVVAHDASGYVDEVRDQIHRLARALSTSSVGPTQLHRNVTIVSAAQMRPGDLEVLEAAAGAVFDTEGGDLREQLARDRHEPRLIPSFSPSRSTYDDEATLPLTRRQDLLFDNGFGGFDRDRNEYVVFVTPGREPTDSTPAPWCNVLANPEFGALVSDRGFGSTWARNAGENRLTPWTNDPVCDPPSEAIYLRDEETASVWSPTPGPKPAALPYEISHGMGYSRYRHRSHGLMQSLRVMVHSRQPVKLAELSIENLTDRRRRVTVTYSADWVLGTRSATHAPFVGQRYEPDARAVLATNPWNIDFPEQVAFLAASEKVHGFTADRVEFFGVGGPADPDALRRWGLSNSEQSGSQPCAAIQVHVDLEPGDSHRLHFAIGWGADREAALSLATECTRSEFVDSAFTELGAMWDERLGRVRVATPDPATDLMLNTWAPYQTLSSRVFARTGFYQSSGAIGFRDQLQDVMALCTAAPDLVRKHILSAAAHQFDAGDVLHWWHPPAGQGVRTRCSDDLLWLPFAVAHYVEATGDDAILDERAPFLTGPELAPDETERYAQFDASSESASVYEHCVRALDRAYALGSRGLPLMGGGDWNDGMNLVGSDGQGESVWLGWFLYATTKQFAAACRRGDRDSELRQLEQRCATLVEPLEAAWDGDWYRRAYYDDGTPLGSAGASEARIDSISQSWAVLSGAADKRRARRAVQSAVRELVDEDARLVRLLWPPFDRDAHEPGYIKGYPPGIRENGAQYTHAAIWLVWALFESGEHDEAERLFRFLNPITHARTIDEARHYGVEPYVVAADVYSTGPHRGRGGWSWYTGSAAWYWRLGIEALLGIRVAWPFLDIRPAIPAAWPGYRASFKTGTASFEIEVTNPDGHYDGIAALSVDRRPVASGRVDLRRYRGSHHVAIRLGRAQTGM